ncbi:hypothetical protein EJ06DRAFT_481255 [Trichodelitschia bisporula]|uniref:Cyclin-domain-containing protein n=1 Tax=Trichodelitschia bisporula TaxID=703511 RepID=A0A6G1HNY6_9PEZI|nr:hypothetical protein EJ06DRAFT_481255 [Trichodelitschia bisporula]
MRSSVAPSLRLPKSIRAPQASMPQLAAEVTCLFWFEHGRTLAAIEENPRQIRTHCAEFPPSPGFLKWATTLLSTTQVSRNVICLALLFIYRLKKANAHVCGKAGSEYRLLTVALMLGNKFLDDNTYTNRTWADVSGISVQEIHVMEMEFLGNMRYGLYTSEQQWKDWQVKLGIFGTYIDRAIKSLEAAPAHGLPLPSPSATQEGRASVSGYNVQHGLPNSSTPLLLPRVASTSVSPIGPLPELDPRFNGRKRSYDANWFEAPPKRHIPLTYYSNGPQPPGHHSLPEHQLNQPHLPPVHAPSLPRMPPLSLSIPGQSSAVLQLPLPPLPLDLPGPRAMASVFPAPHLYPQSGAAPTSVPPLQIPAQQPMPTDNSRQLSPYPIHSNGSSPTSMYEGNHTPSQDRRLSPSHYLHDRNSPFRPIRLVQTLLAPPISSGQVQNAPMQVRQDQMQYHTVGQPERRAGGQLPYISQERWVLPHPTQRYNWSNTSQGQ